MMNLSDWGVWLESGTGEIPSRRWFSVREIMESIAGDEQARDVIGDAFANAKIESHILPEFDPASVPMAPWKIPDDTWAEVIVNPPAAEEIE